MPPTTIDEVLQALDLIIATCQRRESPAGYFAAMYRRVTAEVGVRIAKGEFADGPRMIRFDVLFAQRYLDAWAQQERGEKPTGVWGLAFAAGERWRPVVLQHLLLGMNAHINLDLGIVAAEVAPGAQLAGMKGDFDLINGVLASQVDDLQRRMAEIWPAVRWIDGVGGTMDEAVINFSMRHARDQAWRFAVGLAAVQDSTMRLTAIRTVDEAMTAIGKRVLSPGVRLSTILTAVRLRERGSVAAKIDVLLR